MECSAAPVHGRILKAAVAHLILSVLVLPLTRAQTAEPPPRPVQAAPYIARTAPQWVPLAPSGAKAQAKAGGVGVTALSPERVSLRVSLAGMGTSKVRATDGKDYDVLGLPGASKIEIGKPDLPAFAQWLAVPNGTQVTLHAIPGKARVFEGVDIAPLQPPIEDFMGAAVPPFTKDNAVYGDDANYPGDFARAEPVTTVRGQDRTLLWLYPFQYNPVRRQLRVYSELQVEVSFEGRPQPRPERLESPRFDAIWDRLAPNASAVAAAQADAAALRDTQEADFFQIDGNGVNGGCEHLVICDPAFVTAADTLAAWKRLSGISTKVVTTVVTGTTTAAIEAYVDASQAWTPAPSSALLIGDAEHIPCFYNVSHASDPSRPTNGGMMQGQVASDRYYGDTNDDWYGDVLMGRLPVDSLAEAQIAVDRIIDYERTPPDAASYPNFYGHAGIAAYFQDSDDNGYADRRFAKTSEDIYQFLTASEGYTADRIYYTPTSVTPTNWYSGANYVFENDTSGAALPAYLLKPTFPWDGGTSDITSAFNTGAFLFTHRDHGSRLIRWHPSGSIAYSGGWADPEFQAIHVDALSNGALTPIVWSLNCQTGWFDNETDAATYDYYSGGSVLGQLYTDTNDECFCEHFVRHSNGGASGVIGATRNSFSGYNDRLAWGWMDALWPGFIEYHSGSYGGADAIHEMGAVFEYGKAYMITRYGLGSYSQTALDEYIWFGDPTTMIRTAPPRVLSVTHPATVQQSVATNVTVTVEQGGSPVEDARVAISRAAASDDYWSGLTDVTGSITFNGVTASQLGGYNVVASAHNCLPYEGSITSVPPDALSVTPTSGLAAAGPHGGPFSPVQETYTLTNNGGSPLDWTAAKTAAWLDLSETGGTLDAEASTPVVVSINAVADGLSPGSYADTVLFTNTTTAVDQPRSVSLEVRDVNAFEWSAVATPEYVDNPFGVTLTAIDSLGETVLGFTGTADLQGLISIAPTIGSGTSDWIYPLATYYHDARTQVIYLQSEVGSEGTISSLALDVTQLPAQAMDNWTIRMKHTALASYATASWEDSGWTTVYQSNEAISTTGWHIFSFSTPFDYNGLDNLMIDFSFNNASWTSDGQCAYSTPGGTRSIYYRTDSGYGDPLTWSGTSSPTPNSSTYVPNIQLSMSLEVAITPTSTANFVAGVWTGDVTVLEAAAGMHLNADDAAGHTGDSNTFNAIVDAEAPVAQCKDISVSLSSPTIAPADIDDGSSDNVGITLWLVDGAAQRTFTCADAAASPVTVTLHVEDAQGNPDECTASVTVVDDFGPMAACQDATVYLSSPTLLPADIDNGSSDNCAIVTRLIDGAANRTFTCADIATNPNEVTLRVEDAAGLFDTCTAEVTVLDDVSPTAVCQNVTVNLSSPTLAASDIDNGSSDNCGIVTRLIDGAANRTFTCADIATNPNVLTLRVEDAAGLFDTCTAEVTVVDDVSPTAVCQNVTVNLSSPTLAATDIDNGSSDNCGIVTYLIDGAANHTFTCADIATNPNEVTLRVEDAAGLFDTCTAEVTVLDDVSPTAVCQNVTVNLSSPTLAATDIDNGSSDNCGIVTYLIEGAANHTFTCADIATNPNEVTLRVEDAAGRFDTCTAEVTVVDDVPPVAACTTATAPLDATGAASIVAADVDGGSTDNCSIDGRSVVPSDFDAADLGDNTVTLTVLDAAGNPDSCQAVVTVTDPIDPTVTVDALLTDDPTPQLTGTDDDNAGVSSVAVLVDGTTYPSVVAPGAWTADVTTPLAEGVYDVEATATDIAANTGVDATVDELVVDLTPPVVTVDTLVTNDTTPVLTGTVDGSLDLSTVEVTVAGHTYTATLTLTGAAGTWEAAVTDPIAADGDYDVQAVARDSFSRTGIDATLDELTIDTEGLTVLVTRAGVSPTDASVLVFDVLFGEPVAPTFDDGDLTPMGTLSGLAAATITQNNDPAYTVTLTVSDPNEDGTAGITLAGATVTDAIGNPYVGADGATYVVHNWFGFDIHPASARLYTGDAHTLQVAANFGNSTPACQWFRDDGTKAVHAGPTTDTWSITNATAAAHAGTYWCELTYDGVAYASNTAAVGVADHLQITAQPVGGEYRVGESLLLEVGVSGGYPPLSYNWLKDTLPVGADAHYAVGPLELEDAGAYHVEVRDDHTDIVVSGEAQVEVDTDMPVASLVGLGAFAFALVLAGGIAARRRRGQPSLTTRLRQFLTRN